jgi:hypothetical protein
LAGRAVWLKAVRNLSESTTHLRPEGAPMLYHRHKEYRIFIQPLDPGWQAIIQPPDSEKRITGPSSRDPLRQKEVLAQSKKMIDDGKLPPGR